MYVSIHTLTDLCKAQISLCQVATSERVVAKYLFELRASMDFCSDLQNIVTRAMSHNSCVARHNIVIDPVRAIIDTRRSGHQIALGNAVIS